MRKAKHKKYTASFGEAFMCHNVSDLATTAFAVLHHSDPLAGILTLFRICIKPVA